MPLCGCATAFFHALGFASNGSSNATGCGYVFFVFLKFRRRLNAATVFGRMPKNSHAILGWRSCTHAASGSLAYFFARM